MHKSEWPKTVAKQVQPCHGTHTVACCPAPESFAYNAVRCAAGERRGRRSHPPQRTNIAAVAAQHVEAQHNTSQHRCTDEKLPASIVSVHLFASAPRSCTLIGQRRLWALLTAIYPCRGSDGAGRGFSAERHSTHGTSHSRPPRRHVPLRFALGRRTQATCGLGTQGNGY